jgi:trans-aconitate 2-methyltransferase
VSWDPQLYLKFSDHRARPALELLARVPLEAPRLCVDLGCGAGNVTRAIASRWPGAEVWGVDSSKEMLARAAATPGKIGWIEADVGTWNPRKKPDLIFSNATLHWILDHKALFARLFDGVNPGGCLAVQMPRNWNAPSHRLMRETLEDLKLGSVELKRYVRRVWVEEPDFYYDLLAPRAKTLDVWETEYQQVLEGDDPVLEWVKSTGLRPILEELKEKSVYLEEYASRLRKAYPRRADGKTLYPFRRLFIVALA